MSSGKGPPRRGNRRGGVWLGTARAKENNDVERAHYYDNPDESPERPKSPCSSPQDGYFSTPAGYGRGKQRTKGRKANGKGVATSKMPSPEYVPYGSDLPLPGDVDFAQPVKGGKKGPAVVPVDSSAPLGSGDVDFGTPQKGAKRGKISTGKEGNMGWWYSKQDEGWHPHEDDEFDKWYATDNGGEGRVVDDGLSQVATLTAGNEKTTPKMAVTDADVEVIMEKNDVFDAKLHLTEQELRSLLDDARLRCSDEAVVRWVGVFDADAFAEELQLKRLEQRRLQKALDTLVNKRKARSPSEPVTRPNEIPAKTLPPGTAGNGDEATPSELAEIVLPNETVEELRDMPSDHASEISRDLSALCRNPNLLLDVTKEGLADTLETKDGLAVKAETKERLVDQQVAKEGFMDELVAGETALCLTEEEFRLLLKDARLECPEKVIQHWAPIFDTVAFAQNRQLKRLEHRRLEKSLEHFLARHPEKTAHRGAIAIQTVEVLPVTSKEDNVPRPLTPSSSTRSYDVTSAMPFVPHFDANSLANQSAVGSSMIPGVNGTAGSCVEQRDVVAERGENVICFSNLELHELLVEARLECPEDVIDRWATVFNVDAFARDRQLKQLEQRRLRRALDTFLAAHPDKTLPYSQTGSHHTRLVPVGLQSGPSERRMTDATDGAPCPAHADGKIDSCVEHDRTKDRTTVQQTVSASPENVEEMLRALLESARLTAYADQAVQWAHGTGLSHVRLLDHEALSDVLHLKRLERNRLQRACAADT
eukprot:GEMP01021481.1.p1 GENE.GEMP01021481.1~~GEMP01021481.1.p1  ORF type:complete len:764 (+),score=174.05 GEMP01021481.1:220-2511(+)